MVKYALVQNKKYVFYKSKDIKTGTYSDEIVIQVLKGVNVFLDILCKYDDNFWLFNVYTPDGSVCKNVYGIPHVLGDIRLHNEQELYDGRFNVFS